MNTAKKLLPWIFFLISTASSAAVLVDTGQSPTKNSGLSLGKVGSNTVQNIGIMFSLSQSSLIQGFSGYIYTHGGGDLTFSIFSVNLQGAPAGVTLGPPGNQLFSTTLSLAGSFTDPSWIGPNNMSLALAAGNYWATFENRSGSTFWGGMPDTGPVASWVATSSSTTGDWSMSGGSQKNLGLRVYGMAQAVPEPSALLMILAGLSVCGLVIRRQARA